MAKDTRGLETYTLNGFVNSLELCGNFLFGGGTMNEYTANIPISKSWEKGFNYTEKNFNSTPSVLLNQIGKLGQLGD